SSPGTHNVTIWYHYNDVDGETGELLLSNNSLPFVTFTKVSTTISNPIGSLINEPNQLFIQTDDPLDYEHVSYICKQGKQSFAASKNNDVFTCTISASFPHKGEVALYILSQPDGREFEYTTQNVTFIWMDRVPIQSVHKFA